MTIKQLSTLLYWLLLLPVVGIALLWLYMFVDIDNFKNAAVEGFGQSIQWQTVDDWQLYLTAMFALLPSLVVIWGVVHLRQTFRAFSQNAIFELTNVLNVKRFAFALMLAPIINTIVRPVTSVMLSLNHPPGEKVLSVSFNSADIPTFLIGLVFWLLAKILLEASILAQENNEFV